MWSQHKPTHGRSHRRQRCPATVRLSVAFRLPFSASCNARTTTSAVRAWPTSTPRPVMVVVDRVTFGDITVSPGARNTVPERVEIAIDIRHPDEAILAKMDMKLRTIVAKCAAKLSLEPEIIEEWHSPAVEFDQQCVKAIEESVIAHGYPYKTMFSGAGHDSVYVSKVVPTAMIFIPCEDGVSHNESENATFEDIRAGGNVLFATIVKMAS